MMTATPQPRKRTHVKKTKLKQAIIHAKNLCLGFEDTIECRLAWETVEELSAEMADQQSGNVKLPPLSEYARREYEL